MHIVVPWEGGLLCYLFVNLLNCKINETKKRNENLPKRNERKFNKRNETKKRNEKLNGINETKISFVSFRLQSLVYIGSQL